MCIRDSDNIDCDSTVDEFLSNQHYDRFIVENNANNTINVLLPMQQIIHIGFTFVLALHILHN